MANVNNRQKKRRSEKQIDSMYIIPNFNMFEFPNFAALLPPKRKFPRWKNRSQQTGKFSNNSIVYDVLYINDYARNICRLIDGTKRLKEVYKEYSLISGEKKEDVKKNTQKFLGKIIAVGAIELQNKRSQRYIQRKGSDKYFFPIGMEIELTQRCQQACLHCYGEFGNEKSGESSEFSTAEILHLMDELKDIGTINVSLTGGEPSCHPGFNEILNRAVKNFKQITIKSNLCGLSDETTGMIINNSDKIYILTSLNGIEGYHNRFVGANNYKKAIDSISKIAKGGGYIHVSMNVNSDNYEMVEKTGEAAYNAGASLFQVVGSAYDFGRAGNNYNHPCFKCDKRTKMHGEFRVVCNYDQQNGECEFISMALEVKKQAEIIMHERTNFVCNYNSFIGNDTDRPINKYINNCGLGRNRFYINSRGCVSLCPVSSVMNKLVLGNVKKEKLTEIFMREKVFKISATPPPSLEDCGECERFCFCSSCVLSAYLNAYEKREECNWYKKYFNDMGNLFLLGENTPEIALQ